MKPTDNQFSAADMADQAAKAFREGISCAIELANIYGHVALAKHLEAVLSDPETPYLPDQLEYGNEDKADYRIQGIWFKLTCGACPEQYDVFSGDKQIAYVRLRFGRLRVDVPDVGGETIYFNDFDEEYKGMFSNEEERVKYLNEIVNVLGEHYRSK